MLKARKTLLAALFAAACIVPLAVSPSVYAKSFKYTSQGDILTFDPHGQNHGLTSAIIANVYETLLTYDPVKYEPVAQLAKSWTQVSPTLWRFELQPNVKFHDGAELTADDVVFSLERAMAPTSNFRIFTQGIASVKATGKLTVEISTSGPAPILLRQLTDLRIMNKAWAVKNKAEKPQDYKNKEDTYAARHANGTGPYTLKSWEPDVKTTMVKNKSYWGKLADENIDEVIYAPIKSDATRVAALLSGEVDFVLDPAPQDVARLKQDQRIKVLEGVEYRTVMFGMDQSRDELLYSNVKGKNPLKDVRVRQALYQSIDADTIKRTIMRNLSQPAGTIIAPQVFGWSKETDQRLPFDQNGARKLLADAGYPSGFELTLDCPNNRYVNDEEICQAVVAMWAKIGVKARLNAMPATTYFPKIQKYDTSIYLMAWGVPTFDALYSLQSLAHTVGEGGDGNYNLGRISNKELDGLVGELRREADLSKRARVATDALNLIKKDVMYIPLHNQVIPWAMKKTVDMPHRADNRPDIRHVKVQ